MTKLEKDLNPAQLEAVQYGEGPLLILAGAGSGKTRVITYRIASLIDRRKVQPDHILAVTFTNKAAEQMRNRVSSLLFSISTNQPLISTFHSFCVRVLRRYVKALGYDNNFSIYDEADQLNVVKGCIKELDLDDKAYSPRSVLSRISYAKNHALSPETVYSQAYDPKSERIAVLYDLYEKRLKTASALDFDDLLLKTVLLLNQESSIRLHLNHQYPFISIDEYQDTNRVQYQLIRLLTQAQQNLCVVGDEDQSIYGWRGADIQNILSFEQDYPNARIIKLEQNYRSTQPILDAAGAVVGNNEERKGKKLWTDKKEGDLLSLFEASDSESEALFVVERILEYQRRHPLDTAAVLYRTNFQSRLFEEVCRRNNLKYLVVGGFSFYERAEIKDLLAYLKLCLNPHDSVSFARVINVPSRGLGKSSLDALNQEASARRVSLWEAMHRLIENQTLPARALKSMEDFRKIVQTAIEGISTLPLSKLVEHVVESSGYMHWLEEEDTEESRSRVENIEELINAARDAESRGESLRDFLDHAALVSDTDDLDEKAKVVLLTTHSAKGLEFPIVFLVGLEEGLFPHSRSLSSQKELEEERRICYVGMTRAQKKLVLTRAKFRRFLGTGSLEPTQPSRFLREVPVDLIENLSALPLRKKASVYEGPVVNSKEAIQQFYQQRGRTIDLAPISKHLPSAKSSLMKGSYVRHPKFGVGTVIRCEGEGDDAKLTVSFPGYGIKKMIQKYAGLEKV
ncbi:MAG: UvrD-helicase domain-containing protein [Terriglobia bacterium]